MFDPQHHEMLLQTTHPSGVEEWFCPTCGRHFVAQWMPTFRRLILSEGAEAAIHQGGVMTIQTLTSLENNPFADIERDNPWTKWLEDLDWGDDKSNFEN